MSFKLGDQLDHLGNPNLAFEMYRSYVEHNKHRFPASVIEVMANANWAGGSASNAPYYSDLESIEINDFGKSTASAKLILLKQDYVEKPFTIEIIYKGLFRFEIPEHNKVSDAALKWRYEQFLFFDPHHSHGLKDKMFTHQIEWITGEIWSITARDVEIKWLHSPS